MERGLFSSVVGNITDASGAGVPGASVKITETSTSEVRTVLTNGEGFYAINLEIEAVAAGVPAQSEATPEPEFPAEPETTASIAKPVTSVTRRVLTLIRPLRHKGLPDAG